MDGMELGIDDKEQAKTSVLVKCRVRILHEATKRVQDFTLQEGKVIRVGRSPSNDVTVDRDGVSQFHAELFIRNSASELEVGGLCIRDNSKNGTAVRPSCPRPSTKDVWEPLHRGSFRVLGSGWQVLMPARGSRGGSISQTTTATLTISIQSQVFAGEDAELDGEEWHPFEAALDSPKRDASRANPEPTLQRPHPPPPPDLDGGAFEEPPPPPQMSQVSSTTPASNPELSPPLQNPPESAVPQQLMDEHVRARMQWMGMGGKADTQAQHHAAGKRAKRSKEMSEVVPQVPPAQGVGARPLPPAPKHSADTPDTHPPTQASPPSAHHPTTPALDPKVAAAWGLPSLLATTEMAPEFWGESSRMAPLDKHRGLPQRDQKRSDDGEGSKHKARHKKGKDKPKAFKSHDASSRTSSAKRKKKRKESRVKDTAQKPRESTEEALVSARLTTLKTAVVDDVSDDVTEVAEDNEPTSPACPLSPTSDDATQLAEEDAEPTSPARSLSPPSEQMEEVQMAATLTKPQKRLRDLGKRSLLC